MRNCTKIVMIMDRSGSMEVCKDNMEELLNGFITLQAKVEGECTFSLIKFDNEYEKAITNMPIKDVGHITLEPRGGTALLDAIGRTMDEVGRELSSMRECDRPNKVMMVVVTDGYENASTRYLGMNGFRDPSKIHSMISHQRDRYQWEFVFIGANQDAISVGANMGFNPGNTLNFEQTTTGIYGAGMRMSNMVRSYRTVSNRDDASKSVTQLCSASANTVTDQDAADWIEQVKQANAEKEQAAQ